MSTPIFLMSLGLIVSTLVKLLVTGNFTVGCFELSLQTYLILIALFNNLLFHQIDAIINIVNVVA